MKQNNKNKNDELSYNKNFYNNNYISNNLKNQNIQKALTNEGTNLKQSTPPLVYNNEM